MRAVLPIIVAAVFSLSGCGRAAGQGPERAQVMFADNCSVCHGAEGLGKPELSAPAIAGLPEWYVDRQLKKFRYGVRGGMGADAEGLRMRPMSRAIPESDIPLLASYVSTLTPLPNGTEEQLVGSAEAGKVHFAACAACHGAEGMGNEALNAPPIAQMQSWYIETQLYKFRNGIRGAHPDDIHGQQMVPMAKSIPNEQAVKDLSAYVSNL